MVKIFIYKGGFIGFHKACYKNTLNYELHILDKNYSLQMENVLKLKGLSLIPKTVTYYMSSIGKFKVLFILWDQISFVV